MPQVDASFPDAKAYDITKIDVVKGTKFTLNQDDKIVSRWFFDNDSVLDINVDDSQLGAEIEASNIGTSEILLMYPGNSIQKTLTINVVSQVLPVVTNLGVTDGGVTAK